MQTCQVLTEGNRRTIKIMRAIVESVCDRRAGRLNRAISSSNLQAIGTAIYAVQSIRERWLWTSHLERTIANAMEAAIGDDV